MKRRFIPILLLLPLLTNAQVEITEIMYAPEEGVAYEWVEIRNNGTTQIDLADWRFNDGSNHIFEAPPKNGGQGSLVLSTGSFAVVAKEADTFLSAHSGFGGTVIDASFSLTDTGKTISIFDVDGAVVDTVTYGENAGAQKNGLSLQKVNGVFVASAPTPGATNNSATAANQGGGQNVGETGNNTDSNSTSASSNSSFPVESKIKTSISAPANGIAGVEVYFKASTVGLTGDPISNARNYWSFGDGGFAEGNSVVHVFTFPGDYTVALEASSDEYGASSRHKIKISAPNVSFKKIMPGTDGFVEISNGATAELDISYWQLRSGGVYFIFPKNTFIAPMSSAIFPNSVTNLSLVPNDTYLLYPSGFVAIKSEESVSYDTTRAITTSLSPQISEDDAAPKRESSENSVSYAETEIEEDTVVVLPATSSAVAAAVILGNKKADAGNFIWFVMMGVIIILALGSYFFLVKNKISPKAMDGRGDLVVNVDGQDYRVIEEK